MAKPKSEEFYRRRRREALDRARNLTRPERCLELTVRQVTAGSWVLATGPDNEAFTVAANRALDIDGSFINGKLDIRAGDTISARVSGPEIMSFTVSRRAPRRVLRWLKAAR